MNPLEMGVTGIDEEEGKRGGFKKRLDQ